MTAYIPREREGKRQLVKPGTKRKKRPKWE